MKLLDNSLIKSLIDDEYSNFYDILRTYNINLYFSNIEDSLHAVVYYSKKGYYNILINESLSFVAKQKAFLHEIKHILTDMPQNTYAVCFDLPTNSVKRIEIEADNFMNYIYTDLNNI